MTIIINLLTNKFFDTFIYIASLLFLSKKSLTKYQHTIVVILFGILALGAILSFKKITKDFLLDIQCATISANNNTTSNRTNSNFTVIKHLSKIVTPVATIDLFTSKS